MKILHTADWHLGDRLGRIDRTDDLRRAVERIAEYCRSEKIDVLLVAGDLFSELARADGLRDAIRHLRETFESFLRDRGVIVAITGNHDNENFCQTLWHAMTLASPAGSDGKTAELGRLHLATGPAFLRLPDRHGGFDVQFVLMPFPTPNRFLHDEPVQKYGSLDEKNRHLSSAFIRKLKAMVADASFHGDEPSVLAAHLTVMGNEIPLLFRLSQHEDIMMPAAEIPDQFDYVALGHIHKPQIIAGKPHVRYSGSIDRLDLGEQNDEKGVVVFEIGPEGLIGEPEVMPLEATPIYELDLLNPKEQMATLAERFAGAERDLVNLHISYTAGIENLDEILRQLDEVFPRWYARDWKETGALGASLAPADANRAQSFEDTVREYLRGELTNHDESERTALLVRVEALLGELEP
jgi:exonuclease SbcD